MIEAAGRAGFNLRRTTKGVSLSFDETSNEQVVRPMADFWH